MRRRGARWQHQALRSRHGAVLRIHGPANHRHRAPQQRLRGGRCTCRHHQAALRCPPACLWPTRAAMPGMARSGMRVVATGRSAVPVTCTVERSAGPSSRPMSDGLMGVACTWISTLVRPRCGHGVDSRLICNVPSGWTRERSCNAVVEMVAVVVMHAFREERGRALRGTARPVRRIRSCMCREHRRASALRRPSRVDAAGRAGAGLVYRATSRTTIGRWFEPRSGPVCASTSCHPGEASTWSWRQHRQPAPGIGPGGHPRGLRGASELARPHRPRAQGVVLRSPAITPSPPDWDRRSASSRNAWSRAWAYALLSGGMGCSALRCTGWPCHSNVACRRKVS